MADKWVVIWGAGANRRPGPSTNNISVSPPLANGQEFLVETYYVPAGKTDTQERWGQMPDKLWIALIYNGQPRAMPVQTQEPQPDPEPVPVVKPLTVTIEGDDYETVTITLNPK